jgi:hypothetical protein
MAVTAAGLREAILGPSAAQKKNRKKTVFSWETEISDLAPLSR